MPNLNLVAYDTAYPGSMSIREDGYYISREDPESMLAALMENIKEYRLRIEDLRDALAEEKLNHKRTIERLSK